MTSTSLNVPLTFKALYFPRVWGGRHLENFLKRDLPDDGQSYGESWEISDRPEAQSVVESGPYEGLSLHQLWVEHRESVFGRMFQEHPAKRFPLLLKILDADQPLSVQVHPSDQSCQLVGGEAKSEWWYVLRSEPESRIYVGLKSDHRWETHLNEVRTQRDALFGEALVRDMRAIQPQQGDSVVIPAGTIHALGQKLMVFEVQQNSDTCYRLYDWNRVDSKGATRPLHYEEAALVVDPALQATVQSPMPCERLRLPHFWIEKNELEVGKVLPIPYKDRFAIGMVAAGEMEVANQTFKKGDFIFIPASLEAEKRRVRTKVSNSVVIWVSMQ